MSAIADQARIAVMLADYATVDAGQKINVIGGGFGFTGVDPTTALTAPQALLVTVGVPPELYGDEYVLTVTLQDASGDPVQLPGPSGAAQPMRVAQTVSIEEPRFPPHIYVPKKVVWAQTTAIFNFAGGLPLPIGAHYTWAVDIDGTHDPRWSVSFYVPGPPPQAVFGGPVGPANIPGVA